MSQIEVNKVIPQGSGTNLQLGDSGDTIDIPAGATLDATGATVTGFDAASDEKIKITAQDTTPNFLQAKIVAGTNVTITLNNAGGNETITFASSAAEVKPTFSSITPSTIENTQTTVTIAGGNFVSIPLVTAINSTTGARVIADEVSFTSATSITAKFTISVDGTYLLYIENPDGNAVQTSAVLTVSDAPAWQTAAGSLGNFAAGSNVGTITITCTDAASFAITSGSLPGGLTLNSAATNATITGTESGATSATTYNFTVTATDAQGQTAPRAFSIAITVGQQNSLRFA